MIGALVVFGLLLAVLAFFFWGTRGDAHEPTAHRRAGDPVNHAELEQAEREVQDADDEESVRDWGPGATRPRPPELL